MNFTNNWATVLREPLPAWSDTITVDPIKLQALGEGTHKLTITSELDVLEQFQAVEIIELAIDAEGGAIATRGAESTEIKSWPAGAFIYAGITAGHMKELYRMMGWAEGVLNNQPDPEQVQILEAEIADLNNQLEAARLALAECRSDLAACIAQSEDTNAVMLMDHNGEQLTNHSGLSLAVQVSGSTQRGVLTDDIPNTLVDHNGITLTGHK